jgi:hypothetical protein
MTPALALTDDFVNIYDKTMTSPFSFIGNIKAASFYKKSALVILFLLLAIPPAIYALSEVTKHKEPLDASIFTEPERITVLDETKGISEDNYLVIGIRYSNNTSQSYNNLRFYIPKDSVESGEVRLTGLVDKKVPLDFDSIQQNDRKYFVFVIPDIAPGQTRKVNIVSFFSKKAGSRQILGEIRTIDGQKIIAKPATVIVN